MPHPGPASGTPGSESTPVGRRAVQLRGLADAALAITATLTVEDALRVVTESARGVISAHVAVANLTGGPPEIEHVLLSDEYATPWSSIAGAGYRAVPQPPQATCSQLPFPSPLREGGDGGAGGPE